MRPPRIVDGFPDEFGKDNVADPKVDGGGRTDRSEPVDESRTIRRHDRVLGENVEMAQPIPRRQALDQVEEPVAMCCGTLKPASRNDPSIQSRREGSSGGGGVL